ncbi:importin-13-like isoform X2 [Drosophila serrata]|uniref:importin-13-like isoform X2 n=1 Tax=Drosophila serrata TaxID=7274 RepID=UPI000A1D32D3|nr:importin-13-like isoform X2 [Drosophila serrata]
MERGWQSTDAIGMEPIDIVRLEEAVVAFYRSNSQDQAITHEWLIDAETSPQAWQFCWQLMQLGKSQEVQFFGAITLHSKLMKHWNEVPPENREELKQKILETIVRFAGGPKIVLNRLCISLGAYIVHMLDEWPCAIDEVINTFQNQQIPNICPDVQLWIMLEVLQAIPEEAQIIHTSVQRVTLRAEIGKRVPVVLQTAEEYLKMKMNRQWDAETYSNMNRAVKCVGTWIKNIGYSIEGCVSITAVLLEVVHKCYWPCIRAGDGCMSADENELAETCLKTMVSIIIQPDCHNYPKSAFVLIKMFLDSLCDITKMEWKRDNDNEDIIVHIYMLFVSSVERHSLLLLSGITSNDPELSMLVHRIVQEILHCTDKPGIYPVEESCSTMALAFWYMLQDEVFAMPIEEQKLKCWEYIKPLYAHLTSILVRKSEQPDEKSLDKWNSDDLECFRCYRLDISDTFMSCYDVLHGYILEILAAMLDEAIADLQRHPTHWTKLEACIYSFQSVADHFGGEESRQIPRLMRVLAEIPYDKLNVKLLGTALETVGSYCNWLKENPTYIPSAINLLVRGLNSSMSAQATLGLKELCRVCQLQMKPYAEPLLNACHASLNTGRMKNSDSVRLMFSIGKLMSVLPPEDIPRYLDVIVSPWFEELQAICQEETKTPSARIRTIFRLNMISTLFSSVNTDMDDEPPIVQPVLLVMQRTMPIFRRIAEMWVEEIDVLEAACSAMKHAIMNLGSSFQPMLQDLCVFIVASFQTRCCAPTLQISKTAIVMFFKEEGCKQLMQQLLREFIQHSFKHFENTPEQNFSNISDTMETFFGCLSQIVKKIPQALEDKTLAYDRLIFYAQRGMTLPESGAIRNSIQFLTHFVMQSRNHAHITEVVLATGEQTLYTAMMCVGYLTPRSQVDKFADILLAMNKMYPAEMAVWMKSLMATPNFPTQLITDSEKARYTALIVKEKVNKRLLQQHLSEMAIKTRGLAEKFQ